MSSEPSQRRMPVSADDKVAAILRVLRGEAPEDVAREMEISLDRLVRWENTFLGGGRAAVAQFSQQNPHHRHHRKTSPGLIAGVAALILALILSGVLIWYFATQTVPAIPAG